jgi:hypothetical protein
MSNKTRRADAAQKNKRRIDHEARQRRHKDVLGQKGVRVKRSNVDRLFPVNEGTSSSAVMERLRDKAEQEIALNNLFPRRRGRRRKTL